MKRPVLFAFMVVCAVFWTVMFIIPFFTKPKMSEEPTKKETVSQMNQTADQTNALGFMVISWIGVGVLWMTQRTPPAEANKAA